MTITMSAQFIILNIKDYLNNADRRPEDLLRTRVRKSSSSIMRFSKHGISLFLLSLGLGLLTEIIMLLLEKDCIFVNLVQPCSKFPSSTTCWFYPRFSNDMKSDERSRLNLQEDLFITPPSEARGGLKENGQNPDSGTKKSENQNNDTVS